MRQSGPIQFEDFKTLFDPSSLIMKFGLRPQSSRRGTAGVGSCSGSWIWVQSQHLKFAKHPKRERERESQKAFEKIGRKIHDKNNWISGTYPENTRKIAGFGCCHGLPSRWVPATPIEIQSLKISERRWYNWLVVWNMTFMTFIFFRGVGIPPTR